MRNRVAEAVYRFFCGTLYRRGEFSGDPHPGNIRILRNGVIGLLDYGMVGRLEDEKREQLADLFLAVHQGNVRACVEQVLVIGKPFFLYSGYFILPAWLPR